jgi:release factor glutamine methyltransferase
MRKVLLCAVLRKSRIQLYTNFDEPLQENELKQYRTYVARRAAREPVAYILGKKGFMDYEFKVTRDTLIPRPETELLVENLIRLNREKGPRRILGYRLRQRGHHRFPAGRFAGSHRGGRGHQSRRRGSDPGERRNHRGGGPAGGAGFRPVCQGARRSQIPGGGLQSALHPGGRSARAAAGSAEGNPGLPWMGEKMDWISIGGSCRISGRCWTPEAWWPLRSASMKGSRWRNCVGKPVSIGVKVCRDYGDVERMVFAGKGDSDYGHEILEIKER